MMNTDVEIAIVGVGCRFPGANNLQDYWRVLSKGENHVVDIPQSRWNVDAFYHPDPNVPGKTYAKKAGLVDGIDEFDGRQFGISDTEAEMMDPQQRMVLDCVHMALEDGGITRADLDGSNTNVYIGVMTDDYKGQVMDYKEVRSHYTITGSHSSIISARVSYVYNLTGPAMTVDTACSSSLVAIDLGSQALRTGSCSAAICGGVNLLLDPQVFLALSKARMLSPTGQCQTFTKFADGYARGEGCGIVILKRLSDALRDKNKIWGTIQTCTNQDGHYITPITAPSKIQQIRLLEQTYSRFNVPRQDIQVIEAHGTGTNIGDPTEAGALGTFFSGHSRVSKTVYIGSVKTNIGHTEAAAGVAGLIKLLLMMQEGQIVKSLWYTKENEKPSLKLSQYGFEVPTTNIKWNNPGSEARMGCVNSFGFGGTNAHAIVKQYKSEKRPDICMPVKQVFPQFVVLTAHSMSNLLLTATHMKEALEKNTYELKALSYTSTCRRDHLSERKVFCVETQSDLLHQCTDFITGTDVHISPTGEHRDKKRVIFVFSGVGTTWPGMGSIFLKHPAFLQTFDAIDSTLYHLAGFKVKDLLQTNTAIIKTDPVVSHIAIFSYQVALAYLWRHFGVTVDAVVGQSVGEVAAAHIAGVYDLETAVHIIYHRSVSLGEIKSGTMVVAKNIDINEIESYCKSTETLTIAVYISPVACTVSGKKDDIWQLEKHITKQYGEKVKVIHLNVPCAYHSPLVSDAAVSFSSKIPQIQTKSSTAQIYSTVTGSLETSQIFSTPFYWQRNVQNSVLFREAIENSVSDSHHNIFVEIGPNPVLSAHANDIFLNNEDVNVVASSRTDKERETMANAMSTLFTYGVHIDWSSIVQCHPPVTDIPVHRGHKDKFLYQSQTSLIAIQGKDTGCGGSHPFIQISHQQNNETKFRAYVSKEIVRFVYDHVIHGHAIVPGAFYSEVGYVIGKEVLRRPETELSISLEFLRQLPIENNKDMMLQITTKPAIEGIYFTVGNDTHKVICKGSVLTVDSALCRTQSWYNMRKLELEMSSFTDISFTKIYDIFQSTEFQYGDSFRTIKRVLTSGTEAFAEIEISDEIMKDSQSITLHPCIIDAMLQTSVFAAGDQFIDNMKTDRFLPVAIGSLQCFRKPEQKLLSYTRLTSPPMTKEVTQAHFNILLTDMTGNTIAEIQSFTVAKVFSKKKVNDLSYVLEWAPFNVSTKPLDDISLLVISPSTSIKPSTLSETGLVLHRLQNEAAYDYVHRIVIHVKQNKSRIDAILFLVNGMDYDGKHVLADEIDGLYEQTMGNCQMLMHLTREFTNIKIPVYVVTKNTQKLSGNKEVQRANFLGSEVWGFIRSALVEVFVEVTLIDVQPSLKACENSLRTVVSSTCKSVGDSPSEIVISNNTILIPNFVRVNKSKETPSIRKSCCGYEYFVNSHSLMSDGIHRSHNFHLSPNDCSFVRSVSLSLKQTDRSLVDIAVTSFTALPDWLYLQCATGRKLENDPWADNNGSGCPYFAIEFRGLVKSKNEDDKMNFNKRNDFEKDDEVIVMFPSHVSSHMVVPERFIVKTTSRRFKPGELTLALINWDIAKHVPDGAPVVIYGDQTDAMCKTLLAILSTIKRSNVRFYEDNMDAQKNDVLIIMSSRKLKFNIFDKFEKIVCFQIDGDTLLKLSYMKGKTVTLIRHTDLLERHTTKHNLKYIVEWLNEHTIDAIQETHTLVKNGRIAMPVKLSSTFLFEKHYTYIVTGGLNGLGWEMAKYIAKRGAGIVVTMTRSKPSSSKLEQIEKLQRQTGSKIQCVRADVSDLSSVRKAFDSTEGEIRGVFHCAGITQGKIIKNMVDKDLDIVLKPKVLGTLNLHCVVNEFGLTLEYFVIASSISSIMGSPGQTNYGAANAFVDGFASWRREQGLPCQAINWGALEIGMAANPEFASMFEKRGFNLMTVENVLQCFEACIYGNSSRIVFADMNWNTVYAFLSSQTMRRNTFRFDIIFDEYTTIMTRNGNVDKEELNLKALKSVSRAAQREQVKQFVIGVTSKVLGLGSRNIDSSMTLVALSFDSMSSITLVNVLQNATGYILPTQTMTSPKTTLDHIIDLILNQIPTDSGGMSNVKPVIEKTDTKKTRHMANKTHEDPSCFDDSEKQRPVNDPLRSFNSKDDIALDEGDRIRDEVAVMKTNKSKTYRKSDDSYNSRRSNGDASYLGYSTQSQVMPTEPPSVDDNEIQRPVSDLVKSFDSRHCSLDEKSHDETTAMTHRTCDMFRKSNSSHRSKKGRRYDSDLGFTVQRKQPARQSSIDDCHIQKPVSEISRSFDLMKCATNGDINITDTDSVQASNVNRFAKPSNQKFKIDTTTAITRGDEHAANNPMVNTKVNGYCNGNLDEEHYQQKVKSRNVPSAKSLQSLQPMFVKLK